MLGGKPKQGKLFNKKQHSHNMFRCDVRRVKQSENYHRANSLFEAGLKGDIDLMKSMKRIITGVSPAEDLPDVVDDAVGADKIATQFKTVYETLYNSATSDNNVEAILRDIQSKISDNKFESLNEIQKIDGETVTEAVKLMKKQKLDVSGGYSSDSLLTC